MNLCGILDHFSYKAPDFIFIHESIWFDLGQFENWLIDHRGLNLGDVVPFRSRRLPGPTFPVSNDGQTSMSDEEELFISASSTASKATLLPEHLNGSGWEPSSSRATAGSDLAVSSVEKLDGIESFLAPLTREAIEKADALLKAQEEATTFTTEPASISGWLKNTTTKLSASITEVPHPLALSPIVEADDKSMVPNESFTPRK